MEPKVAPQSTTSTLSLRALLSAALILLLSCALSGTFEYLRSRDHAAQQAAELSLTFGRSSAILIQPLVLSDDRISLNYLFNELAAQPIINGLRLTAPDQTLIALAGESVGRSHTLELVQGDELIGQLTLWSNPEPFLAPLRHQFYEIGLLLGCCLCVTSVVIAFSLKQRTRVDLHREPSFREVADLAERTEDSSQGRDQIPSFDFSQVADYDLPPPAPAPVTAAAPRPAPAPAPAAFAPAPEPDIRTARPQPATSEFKRPATVAEPEAPAPKRREPSFDTDELVSLLKPVTDTDSMPRFTPKPGGFNDEIDAREEPQLYDRDIFAAPEPEPEPPPRSENPLRRGDEEQLGLYTFEQELELLLTPEDAGYLFLIDTRSAHSENLDEEERNELLKNYRTLANSVARIYSGTLETLRDGNMRILFTDADDKDSHGINATCCAMLFTYLYQQYNQQQIRAFRPVVNLHMALVRGGLDKVERMHEEAQFFSRTTQSNALISHTALTEAPLLKESVLSQADIRREDEDKVLVLNVNESYQNLLEKQANHLLEKLAERQNGSAGA